MTSQPEDIAASPANVAYFTVDLATNAGQNNAVPPGPRTTFRPASKDNLYDQAPMRTANAGLRASALPIVFFLLAPITGKKSFPVICSTVT